MIEVRDLVKKYGNHVAVDHLSFTAEKGKIYGFLGPNGAGKSTTMNMMTGYLASTSGEVLIDGHDILKEPEKAKKHIGYLPEVPPLYMEMTPYEQLHFAAELRGIARGEREACVVQVMQETGLKRRQIGSSATCPRVTGREWGWHRRCWEIRISSSWMNPQPGWIRCRSRRSAR